MINGFLLYLQNEREYSPNTLRIYSTGLSDYFSYFDEFTQDNCRRYIAQLGNEGKSPKTVRLRITALERLGEYLRKPVRIKRPKIQKTLNTENVPTEKEYNTLLDYLDGHNPKYAFIVRLLGTTGARVSELTQFTYEHIQQGNVVLSGKGDKYRRFFFQKRLQQEAKGKTGLVCLNRYGVPLSKEGIRYMLKTFAEKTGIDKRKLHPHAFRHFFAKMYLKKTKDVVELADLLGHGSVDTTRLYLQKSYEEKRRDFNKSVDW
ncbi:MAG: tyrosine-type recombinase/integrase [Prevotella sp.]|nr:tyrosine-type recombinase/integrase [Prevotella sp.]